MRACPWSTGLAVLLLAAWAWVALAGASLGDPWSRWVGPRPDRLLIAAGARYSPLVADEPWRLFSSALIHVDLLHLATNVLGVLVLGALGERRVGGARWMAWFALGALAGSLTAELAGVVRSCGASGGGTAWLAALWLLALRDGDADARPIGLALLVHLTLSWLVPQVDVAAHLGGAVAGAAAAWASLPRTRTAVGVVLSVASAAALAGLAGLMRLS